MAEQWILWAAAALASYALYKLLRFIRADADAHLLSKGDHKPDAFEGKVVWVTGASQGLGVVLVKHFAAHGAKLILSARNQAALEAVKASLPTSPDNVVILPFDICGPYEKLEEVVAAADGAFGGAGVDFMVHNAGASQHAMAEDVTHGITDQMFALNTLGPIKLTRALLPHMLRRQRGRFVVIASMAAKVPTPGQAIYSGCKMALYGYFASLATEIVDRNVGVTICCPGPVGSGSDVPVTRSVFGPQGMVTRTEEPNAKGKVHPARYAQLVANAAAHGVDECWIAKHPVLAVGHITQFLPRAGWALLKRIGPGRARAVKEGRSGYDIKAVQASSKAAAHCPATGANGRHAAVRQVQLTCATGPLMRCYAEARPAGRAMLAHARTHGGGSAALRRLA